MIRLTAPPCACRIGLQIEIEPIVSILEGRALAAIAGRGHVVREAGHSGTLVSPGATVDSLGVL